MGVGAPTIGRTLHASRACPPMPGCQGGRPTGPHSGCVSIGRQQRTLPLGATDCVGERLTVGEQRDTLRGAHGEGSVRDLSHGARHVRDHAYRVFKSREQSWSPLPQVGLQLLDSHTLVQVKVLEPLGGEQGGEGVAACIGKRGAEVEVGLHEVWGSNRANERGGVPACPRAPNPRGMEGNALVGPSVCSAYFQRGVCNFPHLAVPMGVAG